MSKSIDPSIILLIVYFCALPNAAAFEIVFSGYVGEGYSPNKVIQ